MKSWPRLNRLPNGTDTVSLTLVLDAYCRRLLVYRYICEPRRCLNVAVVGSYLGLPSVLFSGQTGVTPIYNCLGVHV